MLSHFRLFIISCFTIFIIGAAVFTGATAQDSSASSTGSFDMNKLQQEINYAQGNSAASAVDSNGNRTAIRRESIGTIVVRITMYLALLLLVVGGTLWVLRKTKVVGSSKIGGGSMDVLEVLAIGQGRFITLVRVQDAIMVLASTGQNISLLDKIEGSKALEIIATTRGGTSIVQFKDAFQNFFGKTKKS
jgi:flagellar biogenesis protein FliO